MLGLNKEGFRFVKHHRSFDLFEVVLFPKLNISNNPYFAIKQLMFRAKFGSTHLPYLPLPFVNQFCVDITQNLIFHQWVTYLNFDTWIGESL